MSTCTTWQPRGSSSGSPPPDAVPRRDPRTTTQRTSSSRSRAGTSPCAPLPTTPSEPGRIAVADGVVKCTALQRSTSGPRTVAKRQRARPEQERGWAGVGPDSDSATRAIVPAPGAGSAISIRPRSGSGGHSRRSRLVGTLSRTTAPCGRAKRWRSRLRDPRHLGDVLHRDRVVEEHGADAVQRLLPRRLLDVDRARETRAACAARARARPRPGRERRERRSGARASRDRSRR